MLWLLCALAVVLGVQSEVQLEVCMVNYKHVLIIVHVL